MPAYALFAALVSDLVAALAQIIMLAPANTQLPLCDHLKFEVGTMVEQVRKLHEADDSGPPN